MKQGLGLCILSTSQIKTTLLDEFKNEIPANSFDWYVVGVAPALLLYDLDPVLQYTLMLLHMCPLSWHDYICGGWRRGNPDLQGFLEINDGPPLPLRSIPGMPAFETHFETEETYDIEGWCCASSALGYVSSPVSLCLLGIPGTSHAAFPEKLTSMFAHGVTQSMDTCDFSM